MLRTFALDDPPSNQFFSDPEKISYKEENKHRLEQYQLLFGKGEKIAEFRGKTLTFTVLSGKI